MEPEIITYTEIDIAPSIDDSKLLDINDKLEIMERRLKGSTKIIAEMKEIINNAYLLCEKTQDITKSDIKCINRRINKTDNLTSDVESTKRTVESLEKDVILFTDFMKTFVDDWQGVAPLRPALFFVGFLYLW